MQLKTGYPGQAMVEFLIILPVLLMLILGILQFAFIYQAKITLNYATFEAARAGSLNNAKMSSMETAFASSMAALYTVETGKDAFITARQKLRDEIEDEYVRISIINPGPESFNDHGLNIDGQMTIPNDNLMYRDATPAVGGSNQTIQDANLLKVHIGYCFELIVPFVNRILWSMQRYGPGEPPPDPVSSYGRPWVTADTANLDPGFFGPPAAGSFAESCIKNPNESSRLSIVLYSQSIIRMQSPAIQCEIDDSC